MTIIYAQHPDKFVDICVSQYQSRQTSITIPMITQYQIQ